MEVKWWLAVEEVLLGNEQGDQWNKDHGEGKEQQLRDNGAHSSHGCCEVLFNPNTFFKIKKYGRRTRSVFFTVGNFATFMHWATGEAVEGGS